MKSARLNLHRKSSGFTLIELLIAIAILAVLAAIVIFVPIGGTKKGRDARRESDLKQYQTAVEVNASKNGGLFNSRGAPDGSGRSASQFLCPDLGLTSCSEDPLYSQDPSFTYLYQSNGTGGGNKDATQYVLWGKLETSANYFVICSNGKTGTKAIAGWTNPLAGACPL